MRREAGIQCRKNWEKGGKIGGKSVEDMRRSGERSREEESQGPGGNNSREECGRSQGQGGNISREECERNRGQGGREVGESADEIRDRVEQ
jgi:hypothetical protein